MGIMMEFLDEIVVLREGFIGFADSRAIVAAVVELLDPKGIRLIMGIVFGGVNKQLELLVGVYRGPWCQTRSLPVQKPVIDEQIVVPLGQRDGLAVDVLHDHPADRVQVLALRQSEAYWVRVQRAVRRRVVALDHRLLLLLPLLLALLQVLRQRRPTCFSSISIRFPIFRMFFALSSPVPYLRFNKCYS